MKELKVNYVFLLSCILIACLVIMGANRKTNNTLVPKLNTAHLDRLYEKVEVNGDTVGIIHIYCEYPDYNWLGDSDEGIACVDDASRAAVFYLRHYAQTRNSASLNKANYLLKFLLKMQSENGYFYNFI